MGLSSRNLVMVSALSWVVHVISAASSNMRGEGSSDTKQNLNVENLETMIQKARQSDACMLAKMDHTVVRPLTHQKWETRISNE